MAWKDGPVLEEEALAAAAAMRCLNPPCLGLFLEGASKGAHRGDSMLAGRGPRAREGDRATESQEKTHRARAGDQANARPGTQQAGRGTLVIKSPRDEDVGKFAEMHYICHTPWYRANVERKR